MGILPENMVYLGLEWGYVAAFSEMEHTVCRLYVRIQSRHLGVGTPKQA